METWKPTRAMEPKILERLRLVFPQKTFQMERVPPVMSLDEFQKLTRQAPFIGLAFLGLQNNETSGHFTQGKWKWRLVVVCKAVGNFARQVKGDAFDIGLDDITDVAVCALNGFSFEDIGACHVSQAEVIYAEGWSDKAIILGHIDFEISTTMMSGSLELERLEDFKGINAFWLLPDELNGEEDAKNDHG